MTRAEIEQALDCSSVEEPCEGKLSSTVLKTSRGGDASAEFDTGRICAGSHRFPEEPALVPGEFFASYFSPDGQFHDRSLRHPRSIRDLWRELDGQKTYPREDLVAQFTFADACHAGTRAAGW